MCYLGWRRWGHRGLSPDYLPSIRTFTPWAGLSLARASERAGFLSFSLCLSLSVFLALSVSFCLSCSVCLFLSFLLCLSLSLTLALSLALSLALARSRALSLSLSRFALLSLSLSPRALSLPRSLARSCARSLSPSLAHTHNMQDDFLDAARDWLATTGVGRLFFFLQNVTGWPLRVCQQVLFYASLSFMCRYLDPKP